MAVWNHITSLFGNSVYSEKCANCNEEIKHHHLFAFRKYNLENKNYSIIDEKIFCDNECMEKYFSSHENTKDYQKETVTRCSSYYECAEIGNLRELCEQSEEIKNKKDSGLLIHNISSLPRPFCNPAEAGQVKTAVLMHREARSSSSQAKIALILTVLIIFLTIVNIWMAYKDPKLTEFNDKLKEFTLNVQNFSNVIHTDNQEILTAIKTNSNNQNNITIKNIVPLNNSVLESP